MKIIRSFGFALNGIRYCLVSQTNFRIHMLLAILAICLSITMHISSTEWIIVLLCIAMVFLSEMINTAIEKLCYLEQPDFHPIIKLVKDIAAGGVLIVAFTSFVIGAIIFIPKIVILIKSI